MEPSSTKSFYVYDDRSPDIHLFDGSWASCVEYLLVNFDDDGPNAEMAAHVWMEENK